MPLRQRPDTIASTPCGSSTMHKRSNPHLSAPVHAITDQKSNTRLFLVWHAANRICAKRLIPFLPTLVEALERHEHLHLTEECRSQLLSMSAATADRLLRSQRKRGSARPLHDASRNAAQAADPDPHLRRSGRRPDPAFWKRTWWPIVAPTSREATCTRLTLTDVATGWTECLPLLHRSQETVLAALQRARTLFPFPILGIDTDNGGEFINEAVIAYCEQEQITFTRGRPYLKKDQCFVEQKNGAIVRQVVGYDRLVGEHAYRQLTELYRALRLYVNCFQPSMKLLSKATRREKDALRVRSSENSAPTTAPVRRPTCPEAARTDRGGPGT